MDVAARLEALQTQLERAEERIAFLEDALGMTAAQPIGLGLTGSETRLLAVLRARPMVSKEAAMAALYHDFGRDPPEIKIIDVFVCKLRRKLGTLGITIQTEWGHGYYLTSEDKTVLNKMTGAA